MKSMISTIQAMGFKWGSYTEAGTAGCNGVPGSSEGTSVPILPSFLSLSAVLYDHRPEPLSRQAPS